MQTQHWNLLWTSDIFCSWQVKYLQLSTWLTKANFCLTSLLLISFPGSSAGKESACNAGDLSSIPVLGRSPGGRHGNPLQYSCPENPHGQRSLAGYSPWGRKELDSTERVSTAQMCNLQWVPYSLPSVSHLQSVIKFHLLKRLLGRLKIFDLNHLKQCLA